MREQPTLQQQQRARSKKIRKWKVRLPDGRAVSVAAFQKSEARGEAKRKLGIARSWRLPIGTTVVAVRIK